VAQLGAHASVCSNAAARNLPAPRGPSRGRRYCLVHGLCDQTIRHGHDDVDGSAAASTIGGNERGVGGRLRLARAHGRWREAAREARRAE
jgi:hypothetical protein